MPSAPSALPRPPGGRARWIPWAFVGGFAMTVTPARVGELVRMRWLARESGRTAKEVVKAIQGLDGALAKAAGADFAAI